MTKRLFVFDMDGTITNFSNKILPATIDALWKAKKQGHKLAIATGRPLSFVQRFVDARLFDYLICSNGAYYYEQKSNKIYANDFIPVEIINEVLEAARANNLVLYLSNVGDTICAVGKANKDLKDAISFWGQIETVGYDMAFDKFSKNEIVQLSIWSSQDKIKELKKYFMKNVDKVEIRISDRQFLDTSPRNVSKYTAIKKILPILKIKNENVVAFGDSDNDIEMLAGAGLGFAMGNGTQIAKKVADETIGSHLTPAIANKILEIIKG